MSWAQRLASKIAEDIDYLEHGTEPTSDSDQEVTGALMEYLDEVEDGNQGRLGQLKALYRLIAP